MQQRATALLQRLRAGEAITVTVYGDSITDAWGTDGAHVFHRIFLDCLQYRFPDCEFSLNVAGNPGWTTADALRGFNRQVSRTDPDLLVLQFGGNDRGWGGPVALFRAGLARLLARATDETQALVIACLPPFAEEIEDGEWSVAAREVARAAGVPAACFHRAIRAGPHDFRGSFPYGSHPGSFTHVLMAQELLRVFDAVTGFPRPLRCQLTRTATLSGEREQTIGATLTCVADEPLAWNLRMEVGGEVRELQGAVGPGAPVTVSERFAIPAGLPAGRAYSIPVRLWARSGDAGDFDVAWLTISPAISAASAPGAEDASWRALDARALVLGAHLWRGEDDLSGRFRALLSGDHLRVDVEVTDDQMTVADLADPSRGDSVELYIDLRSQEEQGRPVYSEDVLALQIIPPRQPGAQVRWRNMHALPPDLAALRVGGERTPAGYRVSVGLPVAAIEARRGQDWGGVGFDAGVNDADGGTRRTQMMWMGTAENYLNPAYLPGIFPGEVPDGATRRVLR